MNLHNIKQQSIVDYLQQHGCSPQHIRGNAYWYCSPLRKEHTASFKVNTERNQWYDFATGEHGDIIDLVCILQHCSIAEAMKYLSSASNTSAVNSSTPVASSFSFGGTSIPAASPAHHMELESVKPITHPKLLQYLAERGLKKSDVFSFLWEISYKTSDKTFFALGFANDAGGWELRNPYFKGCMAHGTRKRETNNASQTSSISCRERTKKIRRFFFFVGDFLQNIGQNFLRLGICE